MQFVDLDMECSYSYADYLKWQFEDRVELIKGKIFRMSPAPVTNHQIISGYISNQIYDFLEGKTCMTFTAPFDVRLPGKSKDDSDILTVVQPDICVICDRNKIDERGCLGAPDIVVEILSAGSNKKELRNKYEVYEQSGVKEYWVISPQNRTCIIYTLEQDQFVQSRVMVEGDMIHSAVLQGFILDLAKVFDKLL